MKRIYVSPHSDDVALSCGGQIIAGAAAKEDVLVLNIFSSESEEPGKFGSELFDSINSQRTSEDKSAWESIGIETEYANLPEALLRKVFPFKILGRRDEKIIELASKVVRQYVRLYPDATFYFPAGFGNHVDHLACRRVAFRLLDEDSLRKIVLYEDVPYSWLRFIRTQSYQALLRSVDLNRASYEKAFRAGGEDFLGYLRGKMIPFPRGKKLFSLVYSSLVLSNIAHKSPWHQKKYRGNVDVINLKESELSKKKQLLYNYKSQIPMLFGNDSDQLLRRYGESFSSEVVIEVTKSA